MSSASSGLDEAPLLLDESKAAWADIQALLKESEKDETKMMESKVFLEALDRSDRAKSLFVSATKTMQVVYAALIYTNIEMEHIMPALADAMRA